MIKISNELASRLSRLIVLSTFDEPLEAGKPVAGDDRSGMMADAEWSRLTLLMEVFARRTCV